MYAVLIRTIILFVSISAAVRLMGRRTVGELQTSELVTTLLLSDIAAVPMQEIGIPLLGGIIPIAALVVMEITSSFLTVRFGVINRFLNGRPMVVVCDGVPDRQVLRRLRMTNEDLFESLRKKDVFDIEDVRYAIVETDGQLSVLLRSSAQPPTAQDAGVSVPPESVRVLAVSDGEVCPDSLRLIGWNRQKLDSTLERRGLRMEDVFIMTARADGQETIILREDSQ
ncbi:MAG: DUF421 domain-containing protein [Ruminococcaceae bacterium]|nr:DUF421 domain-containing protein [Oscillospiraceae bacterium]